MPTTRIHDTRQCAQTRIVPIRRVGQSAVATVAIWVGLHRLLRVRIQPHTVAQYDAVATVGIVTARQLDGEAGIEPACRVPKTRVLPLDDTPELVS